MKKGYIAGALFKDADIKQRLYEEEVLKERVKGVKFHNPINDPDANDKSKKPTAQTIFMNDTNKVIESDYIIAELDGEDPGVCMELGVAYGINYMLDLLNKYSKEEVLEKIKRKKVYAHLSDIRVGTANQYEGRYIPAGINQYVVGGIEEMGEITNHFEDIVEIIEKETH